MIMITDYQMLTGIPYGDVRYEEKGKRAFLEKQVKTEKNSGKILRLIRLVLRRA